MLRRYVVAVNLCIALGSRDRRKHTALTLFFLQLAFNVAWSWMFFAGQAPLLGLVNIVPQWLLVVATMLAFWRIDRLAGLCLLSLTGWVAFASLLNFEIWRLN